MAFAVFSDEVHTEYPVCFLVSTIRKDQVKREYIDRCDLGDEDVLVLDLHYEEGKKKTSMTEMRKYITEELVPTWQEMKTQYVLVTDGNYFKALTKQSKVEAHLGYVMPTEYGVYVIYAPSTEAIFYDPDRTRGKIKLGLQALCSHAVGSYKEPGHQVLKFAEYPDNDATIENWLNRFLSEKKPLGADIEGFGLKHWECGIGTIAFAWSKHEGIAFNIDYRSHSILNPNEAKADGTYGYRNPNPVRRGLLRKFFIRARELGIPIRWHNIAFDVYVLIYQLFMNHILDQEGLLYGLDIMLGDRGDWDCTKLITYLATNSCAGNKLGLKDQAQEFAGNYAVEEIKDITKIAMPVLLEYNLIDACSTMYVYDKHWPVLVQDDQLKVYKTLFQPATIDIIQMQLTGMPVNMARVLEVEEQLVAEQQRALGVLNATNTVQSYIYTLRENHVRKRNEKLKKKQISIDDEETLAVSFNPNSPDQLQELLYEKLGLPVLAYTNNGNPSADGDTLEKLVKHTDDEDILTFLKALMDFKDVNKMITDFIPSLKNSQKGPDGWHYLFGNFNLGGTKSGRLSSSQPNLQNLPASSRYAKLIKSCFAAPPGWLFCGLDFASLEDRISALTTKDPNKLKVYTDGYDGHCLRAFAYFGEQMEGIVDTVESINTIAKKYKALRGDSKAPTFALTYQGTWKTLVTNCGFSEEKAKLVEQRYHDLYFVSDQWVASKLDEASKNGYVTVAFGLRLRTPLLHQVIRGTSKTPHEAEAEGRTAGNALGQSYCLLNSRAGIEFNSKVRKSEYRLDIKPCAQIHDAQYFLIRDNIGAIKYTNDNLVEAVSWQDDPEIWHDEVKLGGEFGIFYPDWNTEITLKNGCNENDIFDAVDAHMSEAA